MLVPLPDNCVTTLPRCMALSLSSTLTFKPAPASLHKWPIITFNELETALYTIFKYVLGSSNAHQSMYTEARQNSGWWNHSMQLINTVATSHVTLYTALVLPLFSSLVLFFLFFSLSTMFKDFLKVLSSHMVCTVWFIKKQRVITDICLTSLVYARRLFDNVWLWTG